MAFSNVWDTTFPPDTQLANLLGQDIRNGVKVDVQQRMAAISGLDAAKPAFSGDAQPANWNGILFFATDTGHIYQFNNPTWTDVTSSLRAPTTVLSKNNVQVVHTGDTTADAIYTVVLPVLLTSSILRCTLSWKPTVQGAPGTNLRVFLGAAFVGDNNFTSGGGYTGVDFLTEILIYNLGALNSQKIVMTNQMAAAFGQIISEQVSTSAVDTSVTQNLVIQMQNGTNTDSQNFDSFLVELL